MIPYQNYPYPSTPTLNYPTLSQYVALDITALEELNTHIAALLSREEQLMNELQSMRTQLEKTKPQLAETICSIVSKELDEHMEKVKKTW